MKLDYKKIIPPRYHDVSYETSVSEGLKKDFLDQFRNRNGLYLYGEPGVGKTHIACALAKYLLDQGFEVRFYNTGDFLEKLREEFDGGFETEQEEGFDDEPYLGLFRETMNFKGVLIFDDIGAEKASDWVRERLYLIINNKYENMIPMIFTSNCDKEILSARLTDRVTSRIMGMTKNMRITGQDRRVNKK